jgi:hypothetical protein
MVTRDGANSLSDLIADSELVQQDESLRELVLADERLILSLQSAPTTSLILGVSKRKLKSLEFRLRRREIKIGQNGTPFNKRAVIKNTNRQTAALARKRDGNGKFLDVPIYPKSKPSLHKQCQIFI